MRNFKCYPKTLKKLIRFILQDASEDAQEPLVRDSYS